MRLGLVILLFVVGGFQAVPGIQGGARSQVQEAPGQGPVPDDAPREAVRKALEKQANQERQAQLRRDADRLLQLATELKQSVDKSSENTLSVDVVKKAGEIEKLAHSVKEKMKGN